jgi:hypothetical protein
MHLGRAMADAPLVVAGSGVAIGLPQNHGLSPSRRRRLAGGEGARHRVGQLLPGHQAAGR